MSEPRCRVCIHFYQHYTLDASRCVPVNCGHCSFPRLKSRKPDSPACIHFLQRNIASPIPDRAEVVNFLTKDFLEFIMELNLPPIIEQEQE